MVNWYAFPANRGMDLKFFRQEGRTHYVINLPPGQPDLTEMLVREGWEARPDNPRILTRPLPANGKGTVLPMKLFGQMQAIRQSFDLNTREGKERFFTLHGLGSCPGEASMVGTNRLNQEVYEYRDQRWIGGREWHHHESLNPPALALRFGRRDDFRQLARAITEDVRKTGQSYSRERLEDLVHAVTGPCPSNPRFRPVADLKKAREWLMNDLYQQICQSPVHAGEVRTWNEAVRLQEKIDLDLTPSGFIPPLLTLATREVLKGTENFPTGGIAPVRFHPREGDQALREGSRQPIHAVDNLIVQGTNPIEADRFFLDLREWTVAEAGDALATHLTNRPPGGVSAVLLPAGKDLDGECEAMGILREVALTHGIEAGCRISPQMAQSSPSSEDDDQASGLLALAIGERRPDPLTEVPAVVLRLPEVSTSQGLQRWYYDVRHGRQRLHELFSGSEPETMQYRQVPYQPLCTTGAPRTMISKGHQQAFEKAKQKFIRDKGKNADSYVMDLLGLDRETLEKRFSPEQIDAIALSEWSHERGRGFILADQTGAGKGRSMIGAAASWLRKHPGNRVFYLTQSTNLLRDVLRDVKDTGTGDLIGRVGLLGSDLPDQDDVPVSQYTNDRQSGGIGLKTRLFLDGEWPENNRMLISTYSTFNRLDIDNADEDHPAREWVMNIAGDGHTMVILDECHHGLNPTSNTGKVVRTICQDAGRVLFGSATFLRDYKGSDLYNHCLPQGLQNTNHAIYAVPESNQEYITSMLIEDGVYLRRDHDLMDVPRRTLFPNESEMGRNSIMSDTFRKLGQDIARFRAQFRRENPRYRLVNPLPALATTIVNINKVPQTLRIAREAINRGRKPQIFLSETGGSWMNHLRREAGGEYPLTRYTFKDYIRFKIDQLYRAHPMDIRMDMMDVRAEASEGLQAIMAEIEADIEALPDDLPPSPIDALRHGLLEAGISVGELTGRDMQFDAEGKLEPRPMSGKNERTAIGDRYNEGNLDVIIFNRAVSTGHSYHADPRFRDRRPRSIIIMDTDQSIVDSLQSEGRGNRFNQVVVPEILIVTTGLAAELRKISYYNRKLHSLGAILDSNRDHPALQDSIPDMCNPVGEVAVQRTVRNDRFAALESMIDLGAWLGENQWAEGVDRPANSHSLVSTLLNLLPFLEEDLQNQVMSNVVHEYELHLNDLDKTGRNPLKTRSLDGYVTLHESNRFFLDETDLDRKVDESAFNQPVEIHDARWHRPYPMGINVIRELARNNWRRRMDPRAMADHVRTLNNLRQEGNEAGDINVIIDGFEKFQPGTVCRVGLHEIGIILDHVPPEDRDSHLWLQASGHRLAVIMSGDERPETHTLSSLRTFGFKPVGNILQDTDGRLETMFQSHARQRAVRPVQIITGNALDLKWKLDHNREFKIMQVRLDNGQSTLAAVNEKPSRYSYQDQPVGISAQKLWTGYFPTAIQYRKAAKEGERKPHSFISIKRTRDHARDDVVVHLPNMSRDSCTRFWEVDTGPDIYRLVKNSVLDEDLPEIRKDMKRIMEHPGQGFNLKREEEILNFQKLLALLDRHGEVNLKVPGTMRNRLREMVESEERPEPVPWLAGERRENDVSDLVVAAKTTWQNFLGKIDNPSGRIVQHVMALTGRALPGPAFLQLAGKDLALVGLPAYKSSTRKFWERPEGRKLWHLVTGGDLPQRAPREARPVRACLEAEQSEAILSAMIAVAEQNGLNMVIPRELADKCKPINQHLALAS